MPDIETLVITIKRPKKKDDDCTMEITADFKMEKGSSKKFSNMWKSPDLRLLVAQIPKIVQDI